MPHEEGTGVGGVEAAEQRPQGGLLSLGASVGGLTSDVEPSLIADTDGVGIVVAAVGTGHGLGAARLYRPVTTNNVVVTDALPTLCPVPGIDLCGGTGPLGPHSRAVDYQQAYRSHRYIQLSVARAVAMEVAIVATHFNRDTIVFFFIIFLVD